MQERHETCDVQRTSMAPSTAQQADAAAAWTDRLAQGETASE